MLNWDQRYSEPEYVYGTQPNDFLKANAHLLQGPVLSLAEGEGRNAVFLAKQGLSVTGVDSSKIGMAKAQQLAQQQGVQIQTIAADLAEFNLGIETYQAVVSISAHTPSKVRQQLHQKILRCLKPGGIFLLEAYTPLQAPRNTGGPSDPDLCVTLASLLADFADCQHILAQELEREVQEGKFHTGQASVVQFIAQKKN